MTSFSVPAENFWAPWGPRRACCWRGPIPLLADTAPVGRVAVGMCHDYGPDLTSTMATMFDQLGRIG